MIIQKSVHAIFKEYKFKNSSHMWSHCKAENDTGLWGFLVAYISAEFHSLCCLK